MSDDGKKVELPEPDPNITRSVTNSDSGDYINTDK